MMNLIIHAEQEDIFLQYFLVISSNVFVLFRLMCTASLWGLAY
jgi:hypothetical protein